MAGTTARRPPRGPKPVSATWAKLLRRIPGYDALATAAGCTFDAEAATRALNFFPAYLKHVKGGKGGQPFALELWQQAVIANLFGWKRPDGTRRYRECFLYVGRKQGKTPLAAGVILFMLLSEDEPGMEIYSGAADRDQASLIFAQIKGMVLQDEELRKHLKIYEVARSVVYEAKFSSYKAISADADCVHPDTLLVQRNGAPCPARHAYRGLEILSWEDGRPVFRPIAAVAWQPAEPLYEVVTHRGRRLTVTGRHRFLTQRPGPRPQDQTHAYTWVQACDLTVGRRIAIGLGGPFADWEEGLSTEEAWAMGAWVGDGCSTKFRFINADVPIVTAMDRFFTTLGSHLKHGTQPYEWEVMGLGRRTRSPGRSWIRRHFAEDLAHDKRVPPRVFTGGPLAWAAFLAGYLDTDGCIPTHADHVHAQWSSVSRALLADCQDLLARLGLNASLQRVLGRYQGLEHVSWRLSVNGREQMARLAKLLLPWLVHPEKALLLAARSGGAQARGYTAHTSDRITAIHRLEAAPSVSIEVEGSHTHVTNGLVTHNTKHGFNSHMIVIDELHALPNRELVDVLVTSTGARRQPLMLYTTTADFERPSICNEKYDYACKVRDGVLVDTAFLPVIYEAPRLWQGQQVDYLSPSGYANEALWQVANPNLGVSLSVDYMRQESRRAQEVPAYRNTFLRLHLNVRTSQDQAHYDLTQWDACQEPIDWTALRGAPCFAGLDLASTSDLCCLALLFPQHGYAVLPIFWLPEETALVRERRSRVPYPSWVQQGYIRVTPGNVCDYTWIERDVVALAAEYQIRELAFDPWGSTNLITQLQGAGMSCVAFRQGFASLSAPMKELDRRLASGQLRHDGHPVARWCLSNCMAESDAAGNLKPSKAKSQEKIDFVVALIMALGRAMVMPEVQPSVYHTRGLLGI